MPQLANTDLVIWLIIIAVSVVGQIIKAAGRKAKTARQQVLDNGGQDDGRQGEADSGRSPRAEDPNAELRQFFEALGVPVPEAAKPKPAHQPREMPRARAQVASKPAPRPQPVPLQGVSQLATRQNQPLPALMPKVGLARAAAPLNASGQHRRAIKHFLESRKTLQQAVLLREVLGPPVALRH